MNDDEPRLPSLTVRVVYEDLPDLIEVEARVVSGEWSGATRAYTGPSSLLEEARPPGPDGAPPRRIALDAGADTGIGWFHLRWYPVDRAGHLACHIRLATRSAGGRPEEVWRRAWRCRRRRARSSGSHASSSRSLRPSPARLRGRRLSDTGADPARCGGVIRLRSWAREAILSEANRGSEVFVGRVAASEVP